MILQPSKREMELAQEQIDELKREFTRKRNASIVLCVVLVTAAVLLFIVGLPMISFCSIVISLIFVLRAMDAHGQLDDVGRRSTKTLYPRMSLLDPRPPAQSTNEPSVKP